MTTYLLLALHDDGWSEAYAMPEQFGVSALSEVPGSDRGHYLAYEAGGFSVEVVALERADHP